MPWCEPCGRFYTPSTLSEEGDCPAGHHVADPGSDSPLRKAGAPDRVGAAGQEKVRAPWHFWVLVAALAMYLGWRLIQGVALLAG